MWIEGKGVPKLLSSFEVNLVTLFGLANLSHSTSFHLVDKSLVIHSWHGLDKVSNIFKVGIDLLVDCSGGISLNLKSSEVGTMNQVWFHGTGGPWKATVGCIVVRYWTANGAIAVGPQR